MSQTGVYSMASRRHARRKSEGDGGVMDHSAYRRPRAESRKRGKLPLLLRQDRLRVLKLGALRIRLLAEHQERRVVVPRLSHVPRELRCLRRAVEPPEA